MRLFLLSEYNHDTSDKSKIRSYNLHQKNLQVHHFYPKHDFYILPFEKMNKHISKISIIFDNILQRKVPHFVEVKNLKTIGNIM